MLAATAVARPARAQDRPADPPAQTARDAREGRDARDPRRDPAYFRGRASAPSAGEVLLWVPRVAFFPVHLVTEYGLRVPLRAIVAESERRHIPAHLQFIMNPTPDIRWTPTFVVDLGLLTSVGARVALNNVAVRGNSLRMSAATGGPRFIHLAAEDRLQLGPARMGVRGDYLTRPDRQFFGLGPRSSDANQVQFTLTRADAFAFAGWAPTTHADFELAAGYRRERTTEGLAPSIETVFPPQNLPGFGSVDLVLGVATMSVNTRHQMDGGGGGARLWTSVTFAQDVHVSGRRFVVAEAELEGAVELAQPDRLLVGSLYVADSGSLGSEPIPFTHLPTLGRQRHQGFRWGRFRDNSAFLAEVNYRYPIWHRLDMLWLASLGNTFGPQFAGFDPRLFTGSFGTGLRTRWTRDANVEILAAVGTQRIDEGFGFESFRLFFGINRGL